MVIFILFYPWYKLDLNRPMHSGISHGMTISCIHMVNHNAPNGAIQEIYLKISPCLENSC